MNIVPKNTAMPSCSAESQEAFKRVIEAFQKLPQAEIVTEHHLFAGVYSRTMRVPAGVICVGVVIRCATQAVLCGKGRVMDGNTLKDFDGYYVLEGSPNRQCAVYALKDTCMTMLFATNAKTVEEAEKEFCDDPSVLLSNRENELFYSKKETKECQE